MLLLLPSKLSLYGCRRLANRPLLLPLLLSALDGGSESSFSSVIAVADIKSIGSYPLLRCWRAGPRLWLWMLLCMLLWMLLFCWGISVPCCCASGCSTVTVMLLCAVAATATSGSVFFRCILRINLYDSRKKCNRCDTCLISPNHSPSRSCGSLYFSTRNCWYMDMACSELATLGVCPRWKRKGGVELRLRLRLRLLLRLMDEDDDIPDLPLIGEDKFDSLDFARDSNLNVTNFDGVVSTLLVNGFVCWDSPSTTVTSDDLLGESRLLHLSGLYLNETILDIVLLTQYDCNHTNYVKYVVVWQSATFNLETGAKKWSKKLASRVTGGQIL